MDRFSYTRRGSSTAAITSFPSSGHRPALQRQIDTAPGEDLSPLDASVRDAAEQRLGFDFSHVRIHTGKSAAAPARARHPAVNARDSETAERQARNAYPNNPRAAELQKKSILGTITKPEMSELRGIASFPDNPRAAALYAKQDAGTITPVEQEELRGYFSRRASSDIGLESADRQRENPRAAALRAKQAAGSLSRQEQAELQGLHAYPDNPRAAALYATQTLGTITKEESAELQGFVLHPYNRQAAALRKKVLLGEQLTMDERGVLSDEFYYQAMGEFLIRLERQAREGRIWDEHRWIYEKLRNDPKVQHRAALIRQSGHEVISPFD